MIILIAAQIGPFRHETNVLFIIESRLLLIQIILACNIVAKLLGYVMIGKLVKTLDENYFKWNNFSNLEFAWPNGTFLMASRFLVQPKIL